MPDNDRVAFFLEEAEKFRNAALEEYGRWEKERRDELIRDAAEKGWNAVLQATNALLIGNGYPEEKMRTHRDRRLSLDELETRDEKIRQKGFRDRFGAREHGLHERCFYDGEYTPALIKEDLDKITGYVDDIRRIVLHLDLRSFARASSRKSRSPVTSRETSLAIPNNRFVGLSSSALDTVKVPFLQMFPTALAFYPRTSSAFPSSMNCLTTAKTIL